jgi:hypothetical protein
MHHAVDVGVPLVDQEFKVYSPLRRGIDQFDSFHDVFVEAVEVAGGGYEEVAAGSLEWVWGGL